MHLVVVASLVTAAFTAAMFAVNLLFYREPREQAGSATPGVTVIIPARNEEAGVAACVNSVLANTGLELTCIVADDHSTDRTRDICQAIAKTDPRLQVVTVAALPAGWNGKQHACWCAALQVTSQSLLFTDADVILAPRAIARMAAEMKRQRAALISGFPHQQTGTLLEKMLIPLIHFLLLGYLPFPGLRYTRIPGFAAGCGQFLLVDREAYFASGGHSAIRATMHDGLKMPRLLRQHGFATAIADMDRLANCRMYRSAAEVWRGLGKNATEGLASAGNIVPFTLLLFVGQVLPLLLLFATHGRDQKFALAALVLCYLPRIIATLRFRQSWLGALLHPADIAVLLVLQWWSLARKLTGKQPVWKQRAYQAG